jgi:mortality factor 4-like protein 1
LDPPPDAVVHKTHFADVFKKEPILTDFDTQEDGFHARPSIKLPIPDHLKAILVDDWENVTKNQQLVPLPSAHPVNSILADYLAFEQPKRTPGSAQADILEEVVAGLKEYFERCLGRILLYRWEIVPMNNWSLANLQHEDSSATSIWRYTSSGIPEQENGLGRVQEIPMELSICVDSWVSFYILIHDIFRNVWHCIVTLPELIAQTNMDQQSVNRLREELLKMTNWLGKHATKYFVSEYETPSQGYIEKARGY